ncbi:uncharacterized protein Z519_05632 [Cladophialophora bantiana CBS 173.52]|uniref:Uncharacterized protein n=1 Tax=Cladophialophora bantiana (strain ATCC 10958 / CBS 173.52 / CDC B-1940 / NIH 8579) TaxID=1442370 RepID=A0A0D2EWR4_CLAB1|nr:uncharacterized protein Z519_05632 [Cladophialophora bantiana CBS 173.52]KIW94316.1 hypothetical protein Z519_05632 [Cladophialophora bantiana CBS 173.52]
MPAGTLPYLAKRAASLGEVGLTAQTVEEILDDIGLFYVDLALFFVAADDPDAAALYNTRSHSVRQ